MKNLNSRSLLLLVSGMAFALASSGCTSRSDNTGLARGVAVVQKAEAPKRLALIIGNARYSSAPLGNPANDADLIYRTLKEAGFTARMYTDRSQREMKAAIREFGAELQAAGSNAIGVFYYAGHGVQVNGRNYLIPIGAQINSDADVDIEAVSADSVLEQMRESHNRLNFLILDACRNNPFARSSRSAAHGLAQMDAPAGVLVAYSTAPGEVAADGSGRNSPYSEALARAMRDGNMPAELMFKRARDEVMRVTTDRQTPWESSSLTGQNFYFSAKGPEAGLAGAAAAGSGLEPASAPAQPAAVDARSRPPLRVAAVDRPAVSAHTAQIEELAPQQSGQNGARATQVGRRFAGLVAGFGRGVVEGTRDAVKLGGRPRLPGESDR